jgi:ribose transport system substrate-binding protein
MGMVLAGCDKGGQEDAKKTIAVIPKCTTSPFWELVHQGALKAGEELGYKVRFEGAELETDRQQQINIVEDMISKKVAGIVLAPTDANALVSAVEDIDKSGIPCTIIDSAVNCDRYLSFLRTDNYQGGVMAAERMGEILDGKGSVIIVKWIPNAASTDKRVAGFTETLKKKFPGIKVVDSDFPDPAGVEGSIVVTSDMLGKNKEVTGVFACNLDTAAGAMAAVKKLTDRKVKLVGFDSDEGLIGGLESGVIDSLVIQNPVKMGYLGVKYVVEAIEGRGDKLPKVEDTGVELVTKERLSDPAIRQLLGLKE